MFEDFSFTGPKTDSMIQLQHKCLRYWYRTTKRL